LIEKAWLLMPKGMEIDAHPYQFDALRHQFPTKMAFCRRFRPLIRLLDNDRRGETPDNSPALQCWVKGRGNGQSPVRDGRTVLPSLTGLCFPGGHAVPSAEALGYFHGIPFRRALCQATG